MNKTRYDTLIPSPTVIKATDFAAGGNDSDVNRQQTDSDLTGEISPRVYNRHSAGYDKMVKRSPEIARNFTSNLNVDARSDAIKTSLLTISG